ncbi:ubiquitin-like protein pmt3/smt3 [Reticulomyxa filosa]|uniref:Ubiquitin-like protein pmt3/smt3 n=1 Tax=Reticulomyxa filosa TaxID=46433 RepID=X6MLY7_RETFI|nr:ubiquitin-like protein pmt3/smt3 [Reticulomyxa filosa]|eukprot:ETO14437.1 ubiquitin-like protein pmt3/smt3 [Reticulomyxa filosa]
MSRSPNHETTEKQPETTSTNKEIPANGTANNAAGASTTENPSDHLNLKVKAQDVNKIKKLMDAYCSRVAKEPGTIRFLFDGERIQPDSTPQQLGMENEDEIDAMVEQQGGRLKPSEKDSWSIVEEYFFILANDEFFSPSYSLFSHWYLKSKTCDEIN